MLTDILSFTLEMVNRIGLSSLLSICLLLILDTW